MEIRTYLSILLRYWWVILGLTCLGGVAAALYDRAQTPLYTTTVRVTMRPSGLVTEPRDVVNLIGEIGGRYLTGTFAQTFTSDQVKAEARKATNLSDQDAAAYNLDANVLPDSTVIELRGTGPNPTTLVNYLNATVAATVSNTKDLFRVVDLVPLDTPTVPDTPTSPTPARDVLGASGLAFGLGVLLALAIDYLRRQRPVVASPATAAVPGRPASTTETR
jgi:uncharacterized protein involved in exopolysaccharide biosynthesis